MPLMLESLLVLPKISVRWKLALVLSPLPHPTRPL
jgi:hypothetical protein